MSFMDNYESVADRIKRFWEKYPEGRIVTELVEFSEEHQYAVVKASAYRSHDDVNSAGVDYARGNAANYPQNMKKWFLEDTSTSAIGRVVGLILGSEQRATKENMATVTPIKSDDGWNNAEPTNDGPWGNNDNATTPETCQHGNRIWKEGEKNGKAWGGWSCIHTDAGNQCSMIWYNLSSDGTWKPQVKK